MMTRHSSQSQNPRWVAEAYADLTGMIEEVVVRNGYCVLGVCGGRSVIPIFRILVSKGDIHWEKVHLFFTDERLVAFDDPHSNAKLANDIFVREMIAREVIPEGNIHPFHYNPNDEKGSIVKYRDELMEVGGKYDVLLLGVGEDSHICSLFPNHQSMKDSSPDFVLMHDSPKTPPHRMTISSSMVKKASHALLLFIGEGKQEAFHQFQKGKSHPEQAPCRLAHYIPHTKVITDF